jgi:hypothetical protein
MKSWSILVLMLTTLGAACQQPVDCSALCQDALQCEVEFRPGDDPEGEKITSGERSAVTSCVLGCEESPIVTQGTADCIAQLPIDTTTPAASCQTEVLTCLGVDDEIELNER